MNWSTDQNGDGKVNFDDLFAFFKQTVFGVPLYLLTAVAVGAAYYFGWVSFGKKRASYRR